MGRKLEVDLQISPDFKRLLIDFCNAKQAIYSYNKEEFEKKTKNFFSNIERVIFKHSKIKELMGARGGYSPRKKEIIFRFNSYEEITSEMMQVIIHELNHAWNFEQDKRIGIIPKKFRKHVNPLKNLSDFKIFMEVINEAEAQILCSTELKAKSKNFSTKGNQFNAYGKDETIFEILCIICNQTGREFLVDIEGKDIYGIIAHISKQMKIPENEINNKMQKIARLVSEMKVSVAKYEMKVLQHSMKQIRAGNFEEDIEWDGARESIKEGQEIYEILREAIQQSGYSEEEKKKILLKFEAAQDRIGERFLGDKEAGKQLITHLPYNQNDTNVEFDFGRSDSDKLISDCNYSFNFKEKEPSFLKKIIHRIKNRTKALPRPNSNRQEETTESISAKYHVEIEERNNTTMQGTEKITEQKGKEYR